MRSHFEIDVRSILEDLGRTGRGDTPVDLQGLRLGLVAAREDLRGPPPRHRREAGDALEGLVHLQEDPVDGAAGLVHHQLAPGEAVEDGPEEQPVAILAAGELDRRLGAGTSGLLLGGAVVDDQDHPAAGLRRPPYRRGARGGRDEAAVPGPEGRSRRPLGPGSLAQGLLPDVRDGSARGRVGPLGDFTDREAKRLGVAPAGETPRGLVELGDAAGPVGGDDPIGDAVQGDPEPRVLQPGPVADPAQPIRQQGDQRAVADERAQADQVPGGQPPACRELARDDDEAREGGRQGGGEEARAEAAQHRRQDDHRVEEDVGRAEVLGELEAGAEGAERGEQRHGVGRPPSMEGPSQAVRGSRRRALMLAAVHGSADGSPLSVRSGLPRGRSLRSLPGCLDSGYA